jgi:ABC-type iron transport system FetAB ATPase subunit
VLPIACLLLGGCISGASVTLDAIVTAFVEEQSEIRLLQSFGATKYEAVHQVLATAIQKGSSSVLSMMHMVGVIGILPGMMCGQILSGIPAKQAALYQVMVVGLISLCTLSTVLSTSFFAVESAFDGVQIFRPEQFVRNQKRNIFGMVLWAWGGLSSTILSPSAGLQEVSGSYHNQVLDRSSLTSACWMMTPMVNGLEHEPPVFQASGLALSGSSHEENLCHNSANNTSLDDEFLNVRIGDFFLLEGSDDSMIAELFQTLAGLRPVIQGHMSFADESWHDVSSSVQRVAEWRRNVLYLPQHKLQLRGTPIQFLKRITAFQSWPTSTVTDEDERAEGMIHRVSEYMLQWGLMRHYLNKEWGEIPDEEMHQVLIAIALASKPKVLLLDRSAFLSVDSKAAIKQSIMEYANHQSGSILWIGDDPDDLHI